MSHKKKAFDFELQKILYNCSCIQPDCVHKQLWEEHGLNTYEGFRDYLRTMMRYIWSIKSALSQTPARIKNQQAVILSLQERIRKAEALILASKQEIERLQKLAEQATGSSYDSGYPASDPDNAGTDVTWQAATTPQKS